MKGGECGKQLPRFNIKKKIATSILLTLRRIFLFPFTRQLKQTAKDSVN